MNVSRTAPTTISSVEFAQGDDPMAMLSLLSDGRQAQALKNILASIESIAPKLSRAQDFAALLKKVDACPTSADGSEKILGDLASDQSIQSGAPTLGNVIPSAALALGYNLPTEIWCEVYSRTVDSAGNIVSSVPLHMASPDEMANIRANNTLIVSGSVSQYRSPTGPSSGPQTTTYIDIYNQEGQVRAKIADINNLRDFVNTQVGGLKKQLGIEYVQLESLLEHSTDPTQEKNLTDQMAKIEQQFVQAQALAAGNSP